MSLPENPAIVEPLLRGQAFYEVDSETDAKFSGLLRQCARDRLLHGRLERRCLNCEGSRRTQQPSISGSRGLKPATDTIS
jgi:hypothetical protein